jgi:hypothetical protein
MTWVVGASSLFGYGVMVSDVRVSWSDCEADLLRKSYRIAPSILGGFAGSVDIGMRLIGDLQTFLETPDSSAPGGWRPEWVAEHWAPVAAQIFEKSLDAEKQLGSQILIVGVSPDQHLGAPEFPRVYAIKLDWPDFRPAYAQRGLSVCHIGSGSGVEHYEKAISEFFKLDSPTLKAATAGPTAWAQMLGQSVGRLVADDPIKGISPHVHIQTCLRGAFYEGNNDMTRAYPDGRRIEFRMPQVASTYSDFQLLCKSIGKAAAGVVA